MHHAVNNCNRKDFFFNIPGYYSTTAASCVMKGRESEIEKQEEQRKRSKKKKKTGCMKLDSVFYKSPAREREKGNKTEEIKGSD